MKKLEKMNPWLIIGFVIVLQFVFVPLMYAAKAWPGFKGCMHVMQHAFGYSLLSRMPIEIRILAQLATFVVVALYLWKRNFRVLATYAFVTYLAAAVVQNMGMSPTYGFCAVTVNVIQFTLVALAWIVDAFARRTDGSQWAKSPWAYAALPLAGFAFLAPESWTGLIKFLLTSGTTFGFCLMTPVYLALVFMSYPRISPLTLAVTGSVGFIISLYNMFGAFFTGWGWWVGVLHLPLMITTFAAMVLSFKIRKWHSPA